jgi:uncharacterized protein YecT (DUF1311 family)
MLCCCARGPVRKLAISLLFGVGIASLAQSSSQDKSPAWKAYDVQQNVLRKAAHAALVVEDAHEKQKGIGPCKKPQSSAEMTECTSRDLAFTHKNYEALKKAIGGLLRLQMPNDPPDNFPNELPDRGKEFDKAESVWIQYREIQCQTSSDRYFGGTIRPEAFLSCEIDLTHKHMHELADLYKEDLLE